MNRKICLRVFLTLLITLTAFAVMAVTASAASVTAEIKSITVNIREVEPEDGFYTVDVPINIKENSGFLTVGMDITYPDEFTLAGWTEGVVFPVTDANPSEGPARSSANNTSWYEDDLELNPFTVLYFTFDTNNTATGDLITLTFRLPENIEAGDYNISAVVTDAVAQGDDSSAYPETITGDFTVTAGKVTVQSFPNGKCGDNLNWLLNTKTGVLTISGTGAMTSTPWDSYKGQIVTVEIEDGVTSIIDGAFADCTKLTTITVEAGNANYVVENNVLFNTGKTVLVQYPAGKADTAYTVPATVTEIKTKAFSGCTNLTSIEISEKVTAIGDDAITSGIIRGYPGSAAETYANENSLNFVDITPVYTIKFLDKDGVSVVRTGDHKDGSTVTLPEANEYDHFTFLGWSTGVQGEALITENFIAKKALTLTAVYEEEAKLTVTVKATLGGLIIYDGETDTEFTVEAYAGTVLTFEAIDDPSDDEENVLRNWYDWSTGSAVSITGSEDGKAPTTLEYTVTKNINIDANFISANHRLPVRLVALTDGNGSINTESWGEETIFDHYVDANTPTTLEAKAYGDYVAAYWIRYTNYDDTEVLVATGDTAELYPLGGSVFYEPIFLEANKEATLYIDAATREILSYVDAPKGYTPTLNETFTTKIVTVYDCTKSKDTDENNLFTAFDVNGDVIEGAKNPAYSDNIIINKTEENATPVWKLKLGDKVFTASFKDSFSFNYMFAAGTAVEVYENELNGEAAPTISTVATWTENNSGDVITRFTGLYALPEGYTLVNHGIMMDQNKKLLAALEDNDTGDLEVSGSIIVGRVSNNSENATPLFTVAKRLADANDVWYGRAYLVYTDGETTYVKYADDILPSIDGVDIIEGETPGNEDIYGPLYWDETVVFEN